jgi:serine/threonine-protein kinase HipA
MRRIDELQVLLNDLPVGTLTLGSGELSEFRLAESYLSTFPRPVLGQQFIDRPRETYRSRVRVPPWFSNLLPEGPLRELVANRAGVPSGREFHLLHFLGEDLPGAVRILGTSALQLALPDFGSEVPPSVSEEGLRFSLAGVQLKFSARRHERGLTIPAQGRDGDWIVKLPDARFVSVPENEFATMAWAAASGLRVPETALVELSAVSGLPTSVQTIPDRKAYAVRRFDRSAGGRIHIEDMAQVLGVFADRKYDAANYETVASIVLAVGGAGELKEFLRRLVFVVASGNGDAHLKNWSLMYPMGGAAELSPAYDLVSTIQYLPNDLMALNLSRSKAWSDVSTESFIRLARKLAIDERMVLDTVQAAVQDIRQGWRTVGKHVGYTVEQQQRLDTHMSAIPLLQQAA